MSEWISTKTPTVCVIIAPTSIARTAKDKAAAAGARELACFAWGIMHMPRDGKV